MKNFKIVNETEIYNNKRYNTQKVKCIHCGFIVKESFNSKKQITLKDISHNLYGHMENHIINNIQLELRFECISK